jgi:hypothetical protein
LFSIIGGDETAQEQLFDSVAACEEMRRTMMKIGFVP